MKQKFAPWIKADKVKELEDKVCENCAWMYRKRNGKKCAGKDKVCKSFKARKILPTDKPELNVKQRPVFKGEAEKALTKITPEAVNAGTVQRITTTLTEFGYNVANLQGLRDVEAIESSAPTRVILRYHLKQVLAAVTQAERTYYIDPEDEEHIYKFCELIKLSQTLIKDIRASDDPTELFEDIKKTIIEPLVRSLVETVVKEISQMREQLNQNVVTKEKTNILGEILKSYMRGVGVGSEQVYKNTLEDLKGVLGCDA